MRSPKVKERGPGRFSVTQADEKRWARRLQTLKKYEALQTDAEAEARRRK